MIGVHGLCVDLHQRDAVLGFADYHIDVNVDVGECLLDRALILRNRQARYGDESLPSLPLPSKCCQQVFHSLLGEQ